MPQIDQLFVTRLYRASLGSKLASEIARAALALSAADDAGRAWCRANDYPGYTSYASLNDLPWRFPEFAALAKRLDAAARSFADALDFDLSGRALELDSLWVNVMPEGAVHTAHIHPHSVISGTFPPPQRRPHQPPIRLCEAETWNAPSLGELASPRGAGEPRQE
jgi:uncharacterized protein (TIGR02466 family)